MDEELEGREPKISDAEVLLGVFFLGLVDIVEMIPFLNFLGDFGITDAIVFPFSQIYLRMKGVRGAYMLVGNILELIPVVDWLPIRTATFLITVWVDRHPKVGAAVQAVASVKGLGGAAAGGEVTQAAEGTAKGAAGAYSGAESDLAAAASGAPATGGEAADLGPKKGTLRELRESLENIPSTEEVDGAEENQAEDEVEESEDNVIDLKNAA